MEGNRPVGLILHIFNKKKKPAASAASLVQIPYTLFNPTKTSMIIPSTDIVTATTWGDAIVTMPPDPVNNTGGEMSSPSIPISP